MKRIAYWVITAYVALAIFYGGFAEVVEVTTGKEISSIGLRTVVAILGYPVYFLYIIGIAKMLGAIAIVAPRFPRLKEWAYAGIVFNMLGALISWQIVTVVGKAPIPEGLGTGVFHVFNALHLIVLAMISWALRPSSRVLGTIVPLGVPRVNAKRDLFSRRSAVEIA